MYHAHSKDINRNKSFHPLTYANLRRVEKLKEAEEAKQQQRAERAKELQRDQEERRYDALVLEEGGGELNGQLARFRQVKNIFAAEYDGDGGTTTTTAKAQKTKAGDEVKHSKLDNSSVKLERDVRAELPRQFGGVLAKFHKQDVNNNNNNGGNDEDGQCVKAEEERGGEAHAISSSSGGGGGVQEGVSAGKRARETPASQSTGYITTAEAVQLRRELDLVKKQRLDPLRRVEQFHNDTVAAAARAHALAERKRQQQAQQEDEEVDGKTRRNTSGGNGVRTSDALKEHIKAMLNMKKDVRR